MCVEYCEINNVFIGSLLCVWSCIKASGSCGSILDEVHLKVCHVFAMFRDVMIAAVIGFCRVHMLFAASLLRDRWAWTATSVGWELLVTISRFGRRN